MLRYDRIRLLIVLDQNTSFELTDFSSLSETLKRLHAGASARGRSRNIHVFPARCHRQSLNQIPIFARAPSMVSEQCIVSHPKAKPLVTVIVLNGKVSQPDPAEIFYTWNTSLRWPAAFDSLATGIGFGKPSLRSASYYSANSSLLTFKELSDTNALTLLFRNSWIQSLIRTLWKQLRNTPRI